MAEPQGTFAGLLRKLRTKARLTQEELAEAAGLGQANALTDLGFVRMAGDYPAAAVAMEEALGIYRDLGDRLGQARALTHLGFVRLVTGDYPGAAVALEEALCCLPGNFLPVLSGVSL